jgi:polysaccharide export outer membrane protein
MKLFYSACFISIYFLLASCHTQKHTVDKYIENMSDTISKGAVKNFEAVIQKSDLLFIHVYSLSTKPELSDVLYNPPALAGLSSSSSSGTGGAGGASLGYLVDMEGNIKFPRLGLIRAEGLTQRQLEDTITSKITDLDGPTVIVRFLNYRITVLGEVGHQGTFSVPSDKVTIFEALGLAGDIPVTGKKDNVRIIREINGDREIGTIDLTSKSVFESPYYNLQQNDVVIVEPKKQKVQQVDQSIVLQRITFALGLITSIALLYNLFK